jgi:hypothetical protein
MNNDEQAAENMRFKKTGIYISKKIAKILAVLIFLIIIACIIAVVYIFRPNSNCLLPDSRHGSDSKKHYSYNPNFHDVFCANIKGCLK